MRPYIPFEPGEYRVTEMYLDVDTKFIENIISLTIKKLKYNQYRINNKCNHTELNHNTNIKLTENSYYIHNKYHKNNNIYDHLNGKDMSNGNILALILINKYENIYENINTMFEYNQTHINSSDKNDQIILDIIDKKN